MRFYQTVFGFQEPYRALIDGTFINAALKSKVHIKEQLPKLLGGRTTPVVTECVRASIFVHACKIWIRSIKSFEIWALTFLEVPLLLGVITDSNAVTRKESSKLKKTKCASASLRCRYQMLSSRLYCETVRIEQPETIFSV